MIQHSFALFVFKVFPADKVIYIGVKGPGVLHATYYN